MRPWTRPAPVLAALLGTLLALASPVGAEEGEDSPEPLAAPGGYGEVPPAVAYYQRAQEYYEQGRYQEAARELERARELDPDAPELLYNLALVYERLNEFDRAIGHLERYLRFDLDEEERERVERMMFRLRGAREHMPDEPEPETRTRVVVRRFGLADGWFWGFMGAAMVVGAAAVGTGASALVLGQEADAFVVGQDGGIREYEWLHDTSTGLALGTDVLIGIASAAAVTAILLYALRERPAEEREEGAGGAAGADDWGPPPPSGGDEGGSEPVDGWGPPPPAGGDDGGGDDGGGDDGGGDGEWGPPPPSASAPPAGRSASRARRAALPRVLVGPAAIMIGWEL